MKGQGLHKVWRSSLGLLEESELLTLLTVLHILFGIVEYLGSIVPLIDNFMGRRSAPDMVLTIAIVDLLHYPPGFVRF